MRTVFTFRIDERSEKEINQAFTQQVTYAWTKLNARASCRSVSSNYLIREMKLDITSKPCQTANSKNETFAF